MAIAAIVLFDIDLIIMRYVFNKFILQNYGQISLKTKYGSLNERVVNS